MTYALEVKNLKKVYPKFTLGELSFNVEEGKITGLIGRNGAGKSTTIKSVMRLISSEGEVKAFGKDFIAEEKSVKELIGYVGGGFRFYPAKPIAAIAKVLAGFYPDFDFSSYDSYCTDFGLDQKKKVSELSEGMKVKFSLALALSHGAKLLIMDEPTSGLDPLSREEFCDIILSLVKEKRVTVLFSTHITSDLMRVADNILYISDGTILADEPLESLLGKYLLVNFSSREEAAKAGAIGVKAVKNGYEGLVLNGKYGKDGGEQATLDQIMIHLEHAKKEAL